MGQNDDEDRDAILARRSKLIAIAISGLATTGIACDEQDGQIAPSTACLEAPYVEDPGPTDTQDDDDVEPPPVPCLEAPGDPYPGPCLEAPPYPEPDEEG